jgi:hypothetical protein
MPEHPQSVSMFRVTADDNALNMFELGAAGLV